MRTGFSFWCCGSPSTRGTTRVPPPCRTDSGPTAPRRHRRPWRKDSKFIYDNQRGCESPGKTKRRFWAKFHLFSAYFPPMVPHPPFSAHMFTEFAYFRLFSPYFLPKMVAHVSKVARNVRFQGICLMELWNQLLSKALIS